MKLYELLLNTDKVSVFEKLAEIYENIDILNYSKTYDELLYLISNDNISNDSDLKIVVYPQHDLLSENLDDILIHVSGYSLKEDESYALSYSDWEDWLGMEISEKSLSLWGREKFISYVLYEMTFFGFTSKEVKSEMESLLELIEDLENGKVELISDEEFKTTLYRREKVELDESNPIIKHSKERLKEYIELNNQLFNEYLN